MLGILHIALTRLLLERYFFWHYLVLIYKSYKRYDYKK